MADNPNLTIAEAMDPTRKDKKVWKKCPRRGTGGVVRIARKDCDLCHGTGRVPLPFEQPEHTLRLVEWFMAQADIPYRHVPIRFDTFTRGTSLRTPKQANSLVGDYLGAMIDLNGMQATDVAGHICDIIAEAIKEEKG